MTGARPGAVPSSPRILTLAAVRAAAAAVLGEGFAAAFAAEQAALAALDNPLAVSRRLVEWLVDAGGVSGPAVVVGFAGLHYPPSFLDQERPEDRRLHDAIEAVRGPLEGDPERSLGWRRHFQGISDMSFFGQAASDSDMVAANTSAPRLVDRPAANALRFPVVNIGPWGREFHQRLERVHAPYAFGVLPDLILGISRRVLEPRPRAT